GIEVLKEDAEGWEVKVGAGENWHQFVLYCVQQGWAGVENLSLIPGSVGAGPMQNIGAYGVELKERFVCLEAYHLKDGEVHVFDNPSCEFGYRESVFKRKLKGQYVIVSVTFKLLKTSELRTSYGAIQAALEEMQLEPSVKNISEAVISIRQSKLPDPAKIGNSGSFFKNPIVSSAEYSKIQGSHPNVVGYPVDKGVKLAAGWLIDQAGWKGHDRGGYGVHDRQALVLVNRGDATGDAIYQLSEDIISDIKTKFGVSLEREVNVLP
ncbi:MAG: UDP-N-acetylmuramate dehydrogenase, partial [Bacteroidota bacterium]